MVHVETSSQTQMNCIIQKFLLGLCSGWPYKQNYFVRNARILQ